MTGRNNETKQESVSFTWSSIPNPEANLKEKAFAYYWSSCPREPTTEERGYSYSWSSPTNDPSPASSSPEGSMEARGGQDPAGGAGLQPQRTAVGALQGIAGRFLGGGVPSLRSVGVIGWSAIAGSGAMVALADAGPSVGTQLGSIGGLWLGVTAAIWFMPKILA